MPQVLKEDMEEALSELQRTLPRKRRWIDGRILEITGMSRISSKYNGISRRREGGRAVQGGRLELNDMILLLAGLES